jgi:hypothetical protein
MFYSPIVKGNRSAVHANYTHHLDVGVCCAGSNNKLLKLFNWTKRVSSKQYHEARRNGG